MNKKINTALAIAVMIIIAGILGGTIWLAEKNQNKASEVKQQLQPIVKQETQQQASPVENQVVNALISQSINSKCKAINADCDGDCLDGWSSTCFYDSSKNKESDFKLGFTVEPKNLCYAVFSDSVCGRCSKKFELKKESEFKEVTCEEFYQSIEDKNKECTNCLVDIMTAS